MGIGISFFIRKVGAKSEGAEVWIYSVDDYLKARNKQEILTRFGAYTNVPMKQTNIDAKHTWLTEGLHADFETFISMGSKTRKAAKAEDREAIFRLYSLGVATNRDILAYSFNLELLQERVSTFIEIYNSTVDRKKRHDPNTPVESFIDTDDPRIKWTHRVKESLKKLELSNYEDSHFRPSLYRPFTQKYLYFDHFWNERRYQQHRILPTPKTETENRVICLTAVGNKKPFHCLMTWQVVDLHLTGDSQCFPFYTYGEDGTSRQENITDWALGQFREHYRDDAIGKWDIFHYTYALLHHPAYRERYQANLKRDLPRLPYTPDFWAFAKAGQRLGEIHIGYEDADQYPIKKVETPGKPLRLASRKDETIQRQNGDKIQRFPDPRRNTREDV